MKKKKSTTSLNDFSSFKAVASMKHPVQRQKTKPVVNAPAIYYTKPGDVALQQNHQNDVVGDAQSIYEIQPNTQRLSLKPQVENVEQPVFSLSSVNGQKYIQTSDSQINKLFPSGKSFVKATPVKLAKKKIWEWGVDGNAGAAKMSNGVSDLLKFASTDKSSNDNYAYGLSPNQAATSVSNLVSQNSNYLLAVPPSASPIKPGMAWGAGIFAKWYFKPKQALSTGLRYSYLSTNRQVGYVVSNNAVTLQGASADASARFAGYYGGAYSTDYVNKYHLIELPVGIQWQINKGIKLPVQLDAGVSVGWLISSNALHYNDVKGVYYEDKTLFRKLQAGLYAGISVKLFQHSKRPLYVGPFVQYNISSVLKSSANNAQNFIYGGIKASWVLWKK
ncbi:MAG: hypothetical protein QM802_09440 [Agriterribacter sp.]